MKKVYTKIIEHYENCLEKNGDNHLGVDWPKLEDVDIRYKVMLDIINWNEDKETAISLLDFGCGTAHLLEYQLTPGLADRFVLSGKLRVTSRLSR